MVRKLRILLPVLQRLLDLLRHVVPLGVMQSAGQ